jgi:hypothetical protein
MTSNWLPTVCGREQSTRSRIRLYLVGLEKISNIMLDRMKMTHQEDDKIELLCHSFDLVKVLTKLLLALRKLPAAMVVRTEATHDTVNDQKPVFPRRKGRSK